MNPKSKTAATLWLFTQNRYVITGLFALVWVSFISDIDLIFLMRSQSELSDYHEEVRHFEHRIDSMQENLYDLSSNPMQLERFARERYFMKKPNEDVFRIIKAKDTSSI